MDDVVTVAEVDVAEVVVLVLELVVWVVGVVVEVD